MWKRDELDIAEAYLVEHTDVLTAADYEEVAERVVVATGRDRSAGAMKTKLNTIKRARNNPMTAAKASERWAEQDVERLAARYAEVAGNTKTAEIRALISEFPGRSEKAIATLLRERFPVLYHRREHLQQTITSEPTTYPITSEEEETVSTSAQPNIQATITAEETVPTSAQPNTKQTNESVTDAEDPMMLSPPIALEVPSS
ncbi:hypothetical protein TKK_0005003 [Trichogramma kaykai]